MALERPFSFPPMDVEPLAEHEHGRWMDLKVKNDWRYARGNDEATLHPDLLPWRGKLIDEERGVRYSSKVREAIGEDELSEAAKEKDRISVRGIPRVLARAGFTIVEWETRPKVTNNNSEEPNLPQAGDSSAVPETS